MIGNKIINKTLTLLETKLIYTSKDDCVRCGNCVISNFVINWLYLVKFDCVVPVALIITAFGDVALCSLVKRYNLFAGICCRPLQPNPGYFKINQAFEVSTVSKYYTRIYSFHTAQIYIF